MIRVVALLLLTSITTVLGSAWFVAWTGPVQHALDLSGLGIPLAVPLLPAALVGTGLVLLLLNAGRIVVSARRIAAFTAGRGSLRLRADLSGAVLAVAAVSLPAGPLLADLLVRTDEATLPADRGGVAALEADATIRHGEVVERLDELLLGSAACEVHDALAMHHRLDAARRHLRISTDHLDCTNRRDREAWGEIEVEVDAVRHPVVSVLDLCDPHAPFALRLEGEFGTCEAARTPALDAVARALVALAADTGGSLRLYAHADMRDGSRCPPGLQSNEALIRARVASLRAALEVPARAVGVPVVVVDGDAEHDFPCERDDEDCLAGQRRVDVELLGARALISPAWCAH